MDPQIEKILSRLKLKLQELHQDTSFLDDKRFEFYQKCVQYRSVRLGLNLYGIEDPNISADEMEEIIDAQVQDQKTFRKQFNIDPRKYNFSQIRELVDAYKTRLDLAQYLDPDYSADHMHIAKTFQQEGLPGIEQVRPEKSIADLIIYRQNVRQSQSALQEILPATLNDLKDKVEQNVSTTVIALPDSSDLNPKQQHGLSVLQIGCLSKEALNISYLHLEQAKIALADALVFENVDMVEFKEFEKKSKFEPFTSVITTSVQGSKSSTVTEQQYGLDEERDGFSHS